MSPSTARPSVLGLLLTLGILASHTLPAQEHTSSYLMDLPGDHVQVRYVGGSLDRAANLQRRFELMVDAVSRWTDTAVRLQLVVVGREDWPGVAGQAVPYGLPAVTARGSVALPATADAGVIDFWRRQIGISLPQVEGMPIIGTPEEVASLEVTDLLAEMEVAHVLMRQADIRADTRETDGLLVMTSAWDTWTRFESDRLPEIQAILSELTASPSSDAAALKDFVLAARMLPAARQIVEASGHRPMRRLAKMAGKAGGNVSGCGLLEEFAGLAEWNRRQSPPVIACSGRP